MSSKRLNKEDRRLQIIETASLASKHNGLYAFTSTEIADRMGISHSLIFTHFPRVSDLREAVVHHAIDTMNIPVLVQAIIRQDSIVSDLTNAQKQAILSGFAHLLKLKL